MGGRDRGCREDKNKYPGIKEELTFSTFHHLTDFLTDNFHNQDHDQLLWNYLPFVKYFVWYSHALLQTIEGEMQQKVLDPTKTGDVVFYDLVYLTQIQSGTALHLSPFSISSNKHAESGDVKAEGISV